MGLNEGRVGGGAAGSGHHEIEAILARDLVPRSNLLDGGVNGGLPRSRTRPRDPTLASLDQTQGEIRRSQLGHALDLVGHRVASQNSWFTLGMTDSLSSVEIEDE